MALAGAVLSSDSSNSAAVAEESTPPLMPQTTR